MAGTGTSSMDTYYSVSIANGLGNTSPNDGFIDNLKIEQWAGSAGTSLETTPGSWTYALAQAKRRGTLRYLNMTQQLGLMCNCLIYSITATGASAIVEANPFTFTIEVDRGDENLYTADELNVGQTLTGTAAIQRCIARMFFWTATVNCDVFDPTSAVSAGTWGASTSIPRFGSHILPLTVGPLLTGTLSSGLSTVNSKITVTSGTDPNDWAN